MNDKLKYEAPREEMFEKTLIEAQALSQRNEGAPVDVKCENGTFEIDTKSDLIKITSAQSIINEEWRKIYLQSPNGRRELPTTNKQLECSGIPGEDVIDTMRRAIVLSTRTGGAAVEVRANELRFIVDRKSDAGIIADSLRIISQEERQIRLEGPSGREWEVTRRFYQDSPQSNPRRSPLSRIANVFNKAVKTLTKGRHHKKAVSNNFHP